MDTQQIVEKTRKVHALFEAKGATYNKKERVLDLVEEVGELAQAVLVVEGPKQTTVPSKQKTRADIIDALADILFALLRLADDYDADLFMEYMQVMDQIKARIEQGEFDRTA
jgi:NTP pyrophosphatase (non-canonical NTP hydrolase)